MKSVENQQRQGNPGNNSPGKESEELSLDPLCDVPVGHEGVKDPERDVGEQHEGDDLAARLGLLLGPGGADPPAGLTDDHALEGDLDEKERALYEHQHTGNVQSSEGIDGHHGGEDSKDSIDVGAKHSNGGQQIVQLVRFVERMR